MEIPILDPATVTAFVLLISIPLSLWVLRRTSSPAAASTNGATEIPKAVGGVPLLGNALQYKEDPTGFLSYQQTALRSKLFRLNLAGRKMIIVGADRKAMKQVASQTSSILSARKAVADIGFEYTLGPANVYRGTDWHKRILKKELLSGNKFATQFLPNFFRALEGALEHELILQANLVSKCGGDEEGFVRITDLFPFVRRFILRSQMDSLLSPVLLEEDPGLLEAFMKFQDMIEDTTAKAAVMPRWLALPVCLWPTQSARKKLIQQLIPSIQLAWKKSASNSEAAAKNSGLGPWLKTYLEEETPAEEAAELILGLLFASHKNPSIGAAQTFCFEQSKLNPEQQQRARKEAETVCDHFRKLSSNTSIAANHSEQVLVQANTLRCCVLETTRLTAHTIGAVRYAEKTMQVEMEQSTSGISVEDDNTPATYCIHQGETVAIAHHAMHTDTSVWGSNAANFSLDRPEWKQDDAQTDLSIPVDTYKFTTFSNGIHQCPGAKVALSMMEIVLAQLLVRDAQLVESLPKLSFERATLAQREGPVAIKIRPLA